MRDLNSSEISRKSINFIFGFVALLWFLSLLILPWVYGKPENPGVFGDMFGAVNALFSGLAFGGVIVAIILQKNELSLQRAELEYTRKELEGQKLQLVEQNKTMRKQSFENTYFQLLSLYNDIVRTIDMDNTSRYPSSREEKQNYKPPIVGRDVFVKLYSILAGKVRVKVNALAKAGQEVNAESVINECYIELFDQNKSDLSHYYLTLYNIVKFVDKSDVENKKFYTDILRAQLSSHEILLLYYDVRSKYGKEKFAPLVDTYNLLTGC